MGVIKRGILGGFQNKIGNVVGSTWKGIDVMKSLPISVANPRTAAQTNQRDMFSSVTKVGSILLVNIIKPLWDRFAQQKSGYNAFVQRNINNFLSDGTILFTDVVTSSGSLTDFGTITKSASAATDAVTLGWTNNSGTGSANSDDEVFVALYSVNDSGWEGYSAVATRVDGTVVISTEWNLAVGQVLHAYVSGRRVDGTKVTNSQHVVITIGA